MGWWVRRCQIWQSWLKTHESVGHLTSSSIPSRVSLQLSIEFNKNRDRKKPSRFKEQKRKEKICWPIPFPHTLPYKKCVYPVPLTPSSTLGLTSCFHYQWFVEHTVALTLLHTQHSLFLPFPSLTPSSQRAPSSVSVIFLNSTILLRKEKQSF